LHGCHTPTPGTPVADDSRWAKARVGARTFPALAQVVHQTRLQRPAVRLGLAFELRACAGRGVSPAHTLAPPPASLPRVRGALTPSAARAHRADRKNTLPRPKRKRRKKLLPTGQAALYSIQICVAQRRGWQCHVRSGTCHAGNVDTDLSLLGRAGRAPRRSAARGRHCLSTIRKLRQSGMKVLSSRRLAASRRPRHDACDEGGRAPGRRQ
jgi:hypothetical protein